MLNIKFTDAADIQTILDGARALLLVIGNEGANDTRIKGAITEPGLILLSDLLLSVSGFVSDNENSLNKVIQNNTTNTTIK